MKNKEVFKRMKGEKGHVKALFFMKKGDKEMLLEGDFFGDDFLTDIVWKEMQLSMQKNYKKLINK